jgi:pimeloyl-ACP methyl ester carboxylesterase
VERISLPGRDVVLAADRWTPSKDGRRPSGSLVLLHGGGQTRHSWDRSARQLAAQGWQAITVDARGHGDSGWAPDGDYSTDALVADLRGLVATLADKPVLIGASMGGLTSLVAQGEHGDLARALVLVDVVPKVEPAGVKRILEFMTGAPDGFGSLDEAAEAVRAYNPHRKQTGSLAGLQKNLRLGQDGRWYWHWDPAFMRIEDEPGRDLGHQRAREAARRITVPLLLVRGQQSDVVSPEGVEELLELVPAARYVDVSDAGHMVAGDDNSVFSASVGAFLDELTS